MIWKTHLAKALQIGTTESLELVTCICACFRHWEVMSHGTSRELLTGMKAMSTKNGDVFGLLLNLVATRTLWVVRSGWMVDEREQGLSSVWAMFYSVSTDREDNG